MATTHRAKQFGSNWSGQGKPLTATGRGTNCFPTNGPYGPVTLRGGGGKFLSHQQRQFSIGWTTIAQVCRQTWLWGNQSTPNYKQRMVGWDPAGPRKLQLWTAKRPRNLDYVHNCVAV